jgi:hypothetical protein
LKQRSITKLSIEESKEATLREDLILEEESRRGVKRRIGVSMRFFLREKGSSNYRLSATRDIQQNTYTKHTTDSYIYVMMMD